jgi:hypothetical protein
MYREISKNTDIPLQEMDWLPRHQDAILAMSRWANQEGGRQALQDELTALKKDDWLSNQPAHVWATRLGAAPKANKTHNPYANLQRFT